MNHLKRQQSQTARQARRSRTVAFARRRSLAVWSGAGVLALASLLLMGRWLMATPSLPPSGPPSQSVDNTLDGASYAASRPLPDLPIGRTDTPLLSWHIIDRFPHDPAAYTQGLVFHDGELYESTGLRGQSTLRRVELTTGRVVQQREMSPSHFGEGLALDGENLIQLTWQAGVGFVYDRGSFQKLRRFLYEGEGWGLTGDGKRLIMSDGTATLRLLDPETYEQAGVIEVHDGDFPITDLNELEYVEGHILANVWRTDYVARIRPEDGRVDGWLNLGPLKDLVEAAAPSHNYDVLNGIAWDAIGKRLFVTGKRWPLLFEIEINESTSVRRSFGE